MMKSIFLLIATLLAVLGASYEADFLCGGGIGLHDCRRLGLTLPPPGYRTNIYRLDISENNIAVLYKETFSGYPNVAILTMQHNALSVLELQLLSEIGKLEVADFANNRISNVVAGGYFNKLYKLDLSGNNIASLDPDTFAGAPALQALMLNNNPLIVPSGQQVLRHGELRAIFLQNSYSLSMTSLLSGLPKLEYIDLTSCRITNIEGAFTTSRGLTTVILSRNSIKAVTGVIFPTTRSVKTLLLDGNPLDRVDTWPLTLGLSQNCTVSIANSPLACGCGYEELSRILRTMNAVLTSTCNGLNNCPFRASS